MNRLKQALLVFTMLFLAGCRVELYSGLTEREGNEMFSVLMDHGIKVEKALDKDKMVSLTVPTDDASRSIKILKAEGYPKDKFSSVGEIFPKDGLISSPTEERARYTYSMSQELSSTLSMIDGVITARVHVVLPHEGNNLDDVGYPSSASVFIKYTPELELSGFSLKVKTLVANSIEGLTLDKITVSLFPVADGAGFGKFNSASESFLSIETSPDSLMRLQILFVTLFVLLLLAVMGCIVLFWMHYLKKGSKDKAKKGKGSAKAVKGGEGAGA
ncbi:type III secretion system inner membrane ring lipoprotein SctJ [Endozoicomonadaceae bacterium StTr2]